MCADLTPDLAALHAELRGLPSFHGLAIERLEPTGFTGMAHDHVRLKGLGLILRVPRVSQWALPPAVNLAYQAAAFRQAALSGHTPRLYAVLPPSRRLPLGALLVEEIEGRKPRLPTDLLSLAGCLRAVHSLPLPHPEERRPLLSPPDPLRHMLHTIEVQAAFLPRANLAPEAEAMLREELDWAEHFAAEENHPEAPRTLILTDSHPGNFVIDAKGKAFFVDLEKAMYAIPAIDLAHATLYTSTRFDPDINTALSPEETAGFYRDYLASIDAKLRAALKPWLSPMRRLVWLRTTTWCVKWRVESAGSDGWSRLKLDARTRAHTEACLEDFFAPATIAQIRAEWAVRDWMDSFA